MLARTSTNARFTVYAILASALSIPAASAGEWPQWRGPQRRGVSTDGPELRTTIPATGLQPRWLSEPVSGGGSGGWSSPVVVDGRVYVFANTKTKVSNPPPMQFVALSEEQKATMSKAEIDQYEEQRREELRQRARNFEYEETLYCFDLDDGETLWKRTRPSVYGRFVQSSTPCVYEGRLYVLGAGRNAWCADAATGETVWETTLPGPFRDQFWCSSFDVAHGTAVVRSGRLYALDARDGSVRWSTDDDPEHQLHSSPLISILDGGRVVIANAPGGVTECRRMDNGQLLWNVDSEAGHSSPVLVGDRLITYGGSRRGGLRCYRINGDKKPELAWKYQRVADQGSTPAVDGSTVFAQGDRRVVAVDLATGRSLWHTNLPVASPRYTSLVAGDDQVFYAWGGVYAMQADAERDPVLYEAKINADGIMYPADELEQIIRDELAASGDDSAEAFEKAWDRQVERRGPLACASPALVDGFLIVRLPNRIACYNLRAE